ncbi:MAG: TRAP transporter small permease subunit [Sneathiella sp.]
MLGILQKISLVALLAEKQVMIVLAAAVTGLILLNVITRSASYALYWVDELAIYAMIWMVMIGASMMVRLRKGIAVTLIDGLLGLSLRKVLSIVVDLIVFLFSTILFWLSLLWYDPFTLAAFGFDLQAFSGETFNFIYEEPTTTLGIRKFWIWLVMPVTAVTMTIHALVNLLEKITGRIAALPEMG